LALAQAGGLEDESKNLAQAEIQQMVASVRQNGDPVRGEQLYRRSDMACAACHAIGGVGGKVGPDLTSIGASSPVDYLVESILYPNRKIKEGYHSTLVETRDGQELSGVVVGENSEQLVVRDASNHEISVPKSNISTRTQGGSLMPSSLLDNLSSSEQLDLYRFLSELGKPGPFDASKGNVARLWRVRPLLHTDEQVGEGTLVAGDINSAEWKPIASFVDGRLTDDMVREGAQANRYAGVMGIYAATQFQVPKTGAVQLALSRSPHLAIWIDGKLVASGTAITADLAAGTHTFVVKLDPKKLPEHLRLETNDGTFLTN
jgi:putative heme-binding domain-containing protein